MKPRTFPEGAEAAEILHRESSLGKLTSLRLAARIQDWSSGGSKVPSKIDRPETARITLSKPGFWGMKKAGLLESALKRRRSDRVLSGPPLSRREASTLLWAAAGSIGEGEAAPTRRTAPSAGGLESMTVFLSSSGGDIPAGTWRYESDSHELIHCSSASPAGLSDHLLVPGNTSEWPALFLFSSRLDPLLSKYGDRGYRFALLEIGHSAQNLLLAAAGFGFGAVPIGGFLDEPLTGSVRPAHDEAVLYAVGLGRLTRVRANGERKQSQ